MFEIFKTKKQPQKKLGREEVYYGFIRKFLTHEAHEWITEDKYIKSAFEDFFSQIPLRFIESFTYGKPIVFVPSNGKFGCTVTSNNTHVVIVFPELMQLLKSTVAESAFGVLAHELGHIFAKHYQKDLDAMEAQFEADRIACEMGFTKELVQFLMDVDKTEESFSRLSYILSIQTELPDM